MLSPSRYRALIAAQLADGDDACGRTFSDPTAQRAPQYRPLPVCLPWDVRARTQPDISNSNKHPFLQKKHCPQSRTVKTNRDTFFINLPKTQFQNFESSYHEKIWEENTFFEPTIFLIINCTFICIIMYLFYCKLCIPTFTGSRGVFCGYYMAHRLRQSSCLCWGVKCLSNQRFRLWRVKWSFHFTASLHWEKCCSAHHQGCPKGGGGVMASIVLVYINGL